MSHPEPAIAGFYDHEQERRAGRDRPAPDWGGDELFTSTPRRRRFDRPAPAIASASRRRETTEHPVQRPAARRAATQARLERRMEARQQPLLIEEPPSEVAFAPPVAGRRTITVTGHPDAYAPRRRPAPTPHERVASNPERIAMYAFALGILLIVIAFLTAGT